MKKLLFAALIFFPAIALGASGYGVIRPLLIEYERLNGICKGGSGNDAATWDACEKREPIGNQLNKHGWCWRGPTENAAEYQKSWQECDVGKLDHASKSIKTPPKSVGKAEHPSNPSEPSRERAEYCRNFVTALTVVSAARDTGQSPESALKQIGFVEMMPPEIKKNLVNFVYFDPAGHLIYNTHGLNSPMYFASEACLRDFKPRYQPLK